MAAEAPTPKRPPRFLLIEDVATELATSRAQIYAMVRSGDLPAIKVGGRGQWRVERAKLEEFISRAYTYTAKWVRDNPFGSGGSDVEVELDAPPPEDGDKA